MYQKLLFRNYFLLKRFSCAQIVHYDKPAVWSPFHFNMRERKEQVTAKKMSLSTTGMNRNNFYHVQKVFSDATY